MVLLAQNSVTALEVVTRVTVAQAVGRALSFMGSVARSGSASLS